MSQWTRRDLVKAGVIASAGVFTCSSAARPLSAETTLEALPDQITLAASDLSSKPLRERLSMDSGWRFHLGHASDPAKDFGFGKLAREATYSKSGATGEVTSATMDDSSWARIDLPHDWAVDLPFVLDATLVEHGGKPLGREYPETTIGWYRRSFDVPTSDAGKRIRIDFDGVFRNATVFLNGHYLGENFSGYAPFSFDVTDFIDYGKRNILTLRVDATLGEGWFYEGAGIYRHVWMTKTSPVHIAQWGIIVQSAVHSDAATITISTELLNESDQPARCQLRYTILDASGQTVISSHSTLVRIDGDGGAGTIVTTPVRIAAPRLWSIEQPHMYHLITTLEVDGKPLDRETTPFGIRSIRFDAQKGFLLNGKQVKIKGTCNHQDHAGVGTALPDALHIYRLNILKQMGSNACRTSHNPVAPEFLDACDQLGFLVMEETRNFSSSPEGLSELERMIKRDRNHPSIVIWSLANEEPQQGTPRGAHILVTMKKQANKLDPTRLVTAAMNGQWGKGFSDVVDVQGYNYGEWNIDEFRKAHPNTPMIGTETGSTLSTRGIYVKDEQRGYVSAYDGNVPEWGSAAESWWKFYDAREWLAGGFVWTGFDYRGEPTPYHQPCISSHFGLIDTCGFPKDNYFYYKTWWGNEPSLHLFPHWNWAGREGEPIDVWCYTNQDSVELFLNGRSLGTKSVERNGHLSWKVLYRPGTLVARATRDGQPTLRAERQTTGPAKKLLLIADRTALQADSRDAAVIRVAVMDQDGLEVPTANNKISFTSSGPAKIVGVGNGDPSCHESDKLHERSVFNGLCMLVLQAGPEPGIVALAANSPGLEEGTVSIKLNAPNNTFHDLENLPAS